MGTGYGAPAGGASLSIDGKTYDNGKIYLAPSGGVIWSRTPGPPVTIAPSTALPDASAPTELFVPGLLAAKNLAWWTAFNQYGAERLQAVELNLAVAPTGATVANNLALQVTGLAGSQTITLAMDGTGDQGGRHYVTRYSTGASAGRMDKGDSGFDGAAHMSPYRLTAQTTISGVQFGWGSNFGDKQGYGRAKIVEVMDANLNVLGQSAPYYGTIADNQGAAPMGNNWGPPIPLLTPIVVPAGVIYIGVRCVGVPYAAGANDLVCASCPGAGATYGGNVATAQGAPANLTRSQFRWISAAGLLDAGWQAYLGTNPDAFAGDANMGVLNFASNQGPLAVNVLGAPVAATLRGLITVSLISQGTGPTTPGSDLNVRFVWAYS